MCHEGQSLLVDSGKGEMSARCCGSSTWADIFRLADFSDRLSAYYFTWKISS